MHEAKCTRCGKWYRRGAFEGGSLCHKCRQGDETRLAEFERSVPWEQGENIQTKPALTIPECGT